MSRRIEEQPTFTEIEGLKAAGADVTDILKDTFPGRKPRSRRRIFARLHRVNAKVPDPKIITNELPTGGWHVILVRRSAIPGRLAREQIMLRDPLEILPEDTGSDGSLSGKDGTTTSEVMNHTNGHNRYGIENLVNSAIISGYKKSLKP